MIEADIIGPLVNLLQNAEFDIKKEAAWAISNATSGGSHDQIKYVKRYTLKCCVFSVFFFFFGVPMICLLQVFSDSRVHQAFVRSSYLPRS